MKKLSMVKVLVLALAVVTALTAAFAAQASAKRFVTDDGNIACIMRSKFVRCDVTKHKWTAPPKPKSCEFDYGSSLYLSTQEGKAGFACVSDATGATMEYPAGTRFQTGDNVCRLRKNGKVKCVNKDGGYGFTVGKKRYDVF
jgi:hypothetical protein